jgi:DNA-directed RNA polymerase subunit beta
MTQKKRLYWGNENLNLPPLDLTLVQRESYEQFLKVDLQKYLKEISPIEDFTGKTWELSFGSYYFEDAKLTPDEAVKKSLTYDVPLRVKVKLINKITGDETEQDVFLGDLPKMTGRGTFIVSGIERAVVNQLVRPGRFFFWFCRSHDRTRPLYRRASSYARELARTLGR